MIRDEIRLTTVLRLNGRRAVMAFLAVRSRTTLRKYRALGCPIHYTPTGRMFAVVAELNAWKAVAHAWPKQQGNEARFGSKSGQTLDSIRAFSRELFGLAPTPKPGDT